MSSDIMVMKQMMEKLGKAKTHLEIQKMIKEVDTTGSGTINYREFVLMMLGGKSTILKLYVSALKSTTLLTYIGRLSSKSILN